MHDKHFRTKDGHEFSCATWDYNAREGWCTLVWDNAWGPSPAGPDGRVWFRDLESLTTETDRFSVDDVGNHTDLLERARQAGWDGS
jgi:hypothetical protein